MSIEELEAEALKLDPNERARLAGKLLESLETLSTAENERVWVAEAERRDRELDDGSAVVPSEDAFRDARSRLD